MAKITEVLSMLIPNGGWVATGEEYEGIQFLECAPITKQEFEAGFAKFDAQKAIEDARVPTLAEKLDSIGLTLTELKKALGL